MPTNRRRRAHEIAPHRITPEVIEAWQRGDFHELNRLLQVRPWMVSPFDAAGALPSWAYGSVWAASWPRAVELRAALIEIAGQPGRMDRHGQPLGAARPRI